MINPLDFEKPKTVKNTLWKIKFLMDSLILITLFIILLGLLFSIYQIKHLSTVTLEFEKTHQKPIFEKPHECKELIQKQQCPKDD